MANTNELPNLPVTTNALAGKEISKMSNFQSPVLSNEVVAEKRSFREELSSIREELSSVRENTKINNNSLEGPNDSLRPLTSTNNQAIPEFPATPAALNT